MGVAGPGGSGTEVSSIVAVGVGGRSQMDWRASGRGCFAVVLVGEPLQELVVPAGLSGRPWERPWLCACTERESPQTGAFQQPIRGGSQAR